MMNQDDMKSPHHEGQEMNDDTLQAQSAQPSAEELCKVQLAEWKDRYMRCAADLENYRRRSEKERSQWTQAAQVEMLLGLLPVVDNLERAVVENQKITRTPELEAWLQGFDFIAKAMHKFLEQFDVKAVDQAAMFDPNLHEALMQVAAEDKPAGTIVNVFEKGYTFKGAVLRPAKVSVVK